VSASDAYNIWITTTGNTQVTQWRNGDTFTITNNNGDSAQYSYHPLTGRHVQTSQGGIYQVPKPCDGCGGNAPT
jgi:hypothetical protein